jgi:N-hydroxyarylamine O-acetyltransferase
MVLAVRAEEQWWLADAGFGGWGLLEPVPLVDETVSQQGVWTFRLQKNGPLWVLSCPQCRMGTEQYAFSVEPQHPVDYEPVNYYASHHPSSRFLHILTVQISYPEARVFLFDRDLLFISADSMQKKVFGTDAELLSGLAELFGIVLPEGTTFPLAAPGAAI